MDKHKPNLPSLVTFLSLLFIFLGLSLTVAAPYMLSLFMGGVLALLAGPAYLYLLRKRVGPRFSSFLVTSAIVILVIGPFSLFATLAVRQAVTLGQEMSKKEELSYDSVAERISRYRPVQGLIGGALSARRQLREWAQGAVRTASPKILAWTSNIPEIILQLLLTCLTCYFLLIDGRKLIRWVSSSLPLEPDMRKNLKDAFQTTTVSVIWANLLATVTQTVIILLGLIVLDVPLPFLAAGVTFILAWIPVVGTTPVWVVAATYLYMKQGVLPMAVMLAFGSVAGIADNFVRPILLRGRANMHPLISLVAIFGGIRFFGIVGVFLGPILAAILVSLLKAWPDVGRRIGFIQEPDGRG